MQTLGIKFNMITSYHPQTNGLVERWHHQLKASLKARLEEDDAWMDALPFVMLGLRSMWQEGSDITTADSVYGTPLRLPGQFIPGSEDVSGEASGAFIKTLREKMTAMPPISRPHHSTPPSHVSPAFLHANEVYVGNEAVRCPLQCPYNGPFKVITPGEETFVMERKGAPYTVSTDSLKLAVPDLH